MLSFFKVSSVYKTLILFLFFIILRLPVFIYGLPTTIFELDWMVVAQKMNSGGVLYKDIWENIAPLSAFIYFIINFLFYNEQLVYQILGALLVFFQAMTINRIFIRRLVFTEITLFPAFFYIILSHLFLDSFTLTPTLMANTFLIFTWNYMLLHIGERKKYNAVFEIGALIGIASLFHLPYCLFLAVPVISFVLMTNTKLSDYLLMFFSFLFTIGIVLILYYIWNNEYYFYYNYLEPLFYFNTKFYLNFQSIIIVMAFSILIAILAVLKPVFSKFNNYQARIRQMVVFSFMISFIIIFLDSSLFIYHFFVLIPTFAYLFTYYFLYFRRVLLKELIFLLYFTSIILITYVNFFPLFSGIDRSLNKWIDVSNVIVKASKNQQLLENKKVLVLGDKKIYYQGAFLATPFLNWELAKRLFVKIPENYNSKVAFYEIFKADLPDILVDVDKNSKLLFDNLTILKEIYKPIPNTNFYALDKSKISLLKD